MSTNLDCDVLESNIVDELKPPSMYKVILLNDDYTPMDFVVEVLINYFAKNLNDAESIMLKVHLQGKAICGVYSKDIAFTKVEQVKNYARVNNHPLACIAEENDL